MADAPPSLSSPFGSVTGAALDVIVVVPFSPTSPLPRRLSSSASQFHANNCHAAPVQPPARGVVSSSDFFVSFPSGMAVTRGATQSIKKGAPQSLKKSISSSTKSIRSLFYSQSTSSLSNSSNSIKAESSRTTSGSGSVTEEKQTLHGEGIEVGDGDWDGNLSTHSTMSEQGTSCTEAHPSNIFAHPQQQSQSQLPLAQYGKKNPQLQRLQPQNRYLSSPHNNVIPQPKRRRKGNVRIQINGRYIPQLDMIFSTKRSKKSSSFFLGGSITSGSNSDGEPTCRFVNGNGLQPSTDVLNLLIENEAYSSNGSDHLHDVTLHQQMEPARMCYDLTRTSEHDLFPQQKKPQSIQSKSSHSQGSILHYGRNLLRYILLDEMETVAATAEAHMYLWKSLDSVVVCDVDGTVTKSDVRGVIDSVIQDRFEYCHTGICNFFHDMIEAGHGNYGGRMVEEGEKGFLSDGTNQHSQLDQRYQLNQSQSMDREGDIRFLYLSSRPISLISQTRKLLGSLSQTSPSNKVYKLPPGPILCHTGALSSVLYAELVAKNIHEFKADVLARQVVLSFVAARGDERPSQCRNTARDESNSLRSWSGMSDASSVWDDRLFLAAFGNKASDAKAYEMAGVDSCDIYLIDKESRILCMGLERGHSMDESSERLSSAKSVSSRTEFRNTSIAKMNSIPLAEVCGPRVENGLLVSSTSKVASPIGAIELSFPGERRHEKSESLSLSRATIDVYVMNGEESINHSVTQSKRRSKIKQSIRAFSSRRSFSTKFPSFSSNVNKSPPTKLYEGYTDPLLLARVQERMIGRVGK